MAEPNKLHIIDNLSNQEFLEKHSSPARVGLVGASHFFDIGIKRAQRAVNPKKLDSQWSHAFLFQGRRLDEYEWIMESDVDIAGRNVRFGVQENRISKYFDEKTYPIIAVLDFNLNEEQVQTVLRAGLTLIAQQWKYSIKELLGTLVALPSRRLRSRPNLFQKEQSLYCSAFVQHLYLKINYDFAPDTHEKNTSPEHIFQTLLPHTTYLLKKDL
ncbi:MAG: hypothetical protein HY819_20435 [Acidobacteria bacterium]|nr:hypothetical protein [Acidobacteriota bacterium]